MGQTLRGEGPACGFLEWAQQEGVFIFIFLLSDRPVPRHAPCLFQVQIVSKSHFRRLSGNLLFLNFIFLFIFSITAIWGSQFSLMWIARLGGRCF